jgi:hypothetical protein
VIIVLEAAPTGGSQVLGGALALYALDHGTNGIYMIWYGTQRDTVTTRVIAMPIEGLSGLSHDEALGYARYGDAAVGIGLNFAGGVQANRLVRRNFTVYEVLSEQEISGLSRSAHRTAANNALHAELSANPEMSRIFNRLLRKNVLAHMESGTGQALLNPPGTTWHHPFNNPRVVQLLLKLEHTNPLLQAVLHPGGIGGFGNFYGN